MSFSSSASGLARALAAWIAGLLLALSLLAGPAQALPTIEVIESESGRMLTPELVYWHEPEGTADAAAAFARIAGKDFAPLTGGRANFGFKPGAHWFAVRMVNLDIETTRWLLLVESPLLDRIDIHLRHADGRIEHQVAGDHLPFSARALSYRYPNVWLDLPRDEPVDLLIRVQSGSSIQMPLLLYSPTAFADAAEDQVVAGLYYGCLVAMLLFNLILGYGLRDFGYVWYACSLIGAGMAVLSLYGLGFQYLWPDALWWQERAPAVSAALAHIFANQFNRSFLDLGRRWHWGDRISVVIIGALVVLMLSFFWLPSQISYRVITALALPSSLWLLWVNIRVLRGGYKPARYALLAWVALLAGAISYPLYAMGFLPRNLLTYYGGQIGSGLEMILLAIALSYRYAALRNENERVVREANEQLEARVTQRTAELSRANTELKSTHDQLEQAHTQLVEAQQQLVLSEKMASLGTLTAGVAHEINNPTNFADVAVQQLDQRHAEFREFLKELAGEDADAEVLEAFDKHFRGFEEMTALAHEGHSRIKTIVLDLRQFSRLDEAERKSVPVAEPITSTVNLVRTRFGDIRFELDLDYNPRIECHAAKLGQVYMNLIVNACQAIGDCTDGREGLIRIRSVQEGNQVRIDVIDNGPGMDEATRLRVFEPFFTTKDVGSGTGLGLSIVFGIVRDHKGSIEVASTPGVGTTFSLRLPLA